MLSKNIQNGVPQRAPKSPEKVAPLFIPGFCVGFCVGFCIGFCVGFCNGFCVSFCIGFCVGFCEGIGSFLAGFAKSAHVRCEVEGNWLASPNGKLATPFCCFCCCFCFDDAMPRNSRTACSWRCCSRRVPPADLASPITSPIAPNDSSVLVSRIDSGTGGADEEKNETGVGSEPHGPRLICAASS